jgi:heat shock protein HslJ
MSRYDAHAVLRSLAALLVAAALPAAASAGSCRPDDPAVLRNLEYTGILDGAVTLRDGVHEGEPFAPGGASRPLVTFVDMAPVLHDVDGDGGDEAAVLLAESSGGSGVFTYLAVVACRGDRAVNVGTALLGDRVMIRSLTGRDGAILVEMVAAGPGDPLCCPTRKMRNGYRVRDGKLLPASPEEQGTVSIADLEGAAWRLALIGREERVPEGVKVTAAFADGKVSGSGGCNRYSAAVTAKGPLELSIGPAASTRMACPGPAGEFEQRYLSALQAADRFGFHLGDLVLHYRKGVTVETMRFER